MRPGKTVICVRSMTVASFWNRQTFADCFDLVLTNQNDLVVEDRARIRVHQSSRLDCCNLGGGRIHAAQAEECDQEIQLSLGSPVHEVRRAKCHSRRVGRFFALGLVLVCGDCAD